MILKVVQSSLESSLSSTAYPIVSRNEKCVHPSSGPLGVQVERVRRRPGPLLVGPDGRLEGGGLLQDRRPLPEGTGD